MDKLKKLQALTGQSGGDLAEPQQPRYDPTDSGSDSDEYLTSGRGVKNDGNKATVIYTPLGTYSINFHCPVADINSTIGDPPKEFAGYDLKQGQLAPEDESFVPWAVVKKYPYSYIGVANKQRVLFSQLKDDHFKLTCARSVKDSLMAGRSRTNFGICEFHLFFFHLVHSISS